MSTTSYAHCDSSCSVPRAVSIISLAAVERITNAASGPAIGKWNKFLEARFPLRTIGGSGRVSLRALSKRVAADQIIMYVPFDSSCMTSANNAIGHLLGYAPVVNSALDVTDYAEQLTLFLGSMGIMEGRDRDHIAEKFRQLYWPALKTNWQVWPAAQVRTVYAVS